MTRFDQSTTNHNRSLLYTHEIEGAVDNLNDDERDTTIEGRYPKHPPAAEFIDECGEGH